MSCSWKQLETTFVATITWLNVLSNNIYIARGTHTGLDWGYDTQRVPRKHSLHYYTHTHTHTPSVWTVGMRLVGFMDSCSCSQIMTRPSGCCTMMITLGVFYRPVSVNPSPRRRPIPVLARRESDLTWTEPRDLLVSCIALQPLD